MMAIKISTKTTADTLISKSHWWGFPDLPDGMDFPTMSSNAGERCNENEGEDLLTFICQIKLEDIAPFDSANLLPHQGMLYFFASLNYFLGDLEAFVECIGFWPESSYKVIYVPAADGLHTHKVVWSDGTDACLPAESMCFEKTESMTTTINFWACHSLKKCVMKPPIIFLCFRLMKMNVGDCVFMIVVC